MQPATPLPVMLSLSKHATASRKRRIGGRQHANGEVMLRQAQHDEDQKDGIGCDRWTASDQIRLLWVLPLLLIGCDRWTASDDIVRARHLATPTSNTLARLPFPVTPPDPS
ncbi:MAG: hypothetical protein AMXMBFR61_21350 [Fimbriimonadales bacterium]